MVIDCTVHIDRPILEKSRRRSTAIRGASRMKASAKTTIWITKTTDSNLSGAIGKGNRTSTKLRDWTCFSLAIVPRRSMRT